MSELVFVLLPVDHYSDHDVFLNILKNVVSRSTLDKHHLDSALISGMAKRTIYIESQEPTSFSLERTDETTRAMLLGFWCVNNFPSLGKKLLGPRWNRPEIRKIFVGEDQEVSVQQMDAAVSQLLQLRIVELTVSKSTLDKIRDFVQVPASLCTGSPVKISKQTRLFKIQNMHMEICWHALKRGKFVANENIEQRMENVIPDENCNSQDPLTSQLVPAAKRARLDMISTENAPDASDSDSVLDSAADLVCVDMDLDAIDCDAEVGQDKRDSVIDGLRANVSSLTKEISNLTKWFDPELEYSMALKDKKLAIEALEIKLADSNRKHSESVIQLETQLMESNRERKELETNLHHAKENIETLEMKLVDSSRKHLESIKELETNLIESNRQKLEMIENLRKESDREKNELLEANRKMKTDFDNLKTRVGTIISQLEQKILSLESSVVEKKKGDGLSKNRNTETLETDDEIVRKCRSKLIQCKFGWIKFNRPKNAKYCPGFVYAPDGDGRERAQKITAQGYVTDKKFIFFDYRETIPQNEKDKAQLRALKKLNEKFKFSYQ